MLCQMWIAVSIVADTRKPLAVRIVVSPPRNYWAISQTGKKAVYVCYCIGTVCKRLCYLLLLICEGKKDRFLMLIPRVDIFCDHYGYRFASFKSGPNQCRFCTIKRVSYSTLFTISLGSKSCKHLNGRAFSDAYTVFQKCSLHIRIKHKIDPQSNNSKSNNSRDLFNDLVSCLCFCCFCH